MKSLLAALRLRPLAIGLVAVALVVLLWKSDEPRNSSVPAEKLRGPDEPDSFVVDGRFRSFNTGGKLQESFRSPRIEQFDDRDEAVMETPRARLIDQSSGQPWRMRADKGRYSPGDEIMHLSGNVVLTRSSKKSGSGDSGATSPDQTQHSGNSDARLETEKLTLDNKKRIVHTDAPVVIRDQRSVTHGVGMRGWVDKGVVQLESQVQGTYEPNAKQ